MCVVAYVKHRNKLIQSRERWTACTDRNVRSWPGLPDDTSTATRRADLGLPTCRAGPTRALRATKAIHERALTSEHRRRESHGNESRQVYGRRQRRTNAHALEPSCSPAGSRPGSIDRPSGTNPLAYAYGGSSSGSGRCAGAVGREGKTLRSKCFIRVEGALQQVLQACSMF